VLVDDVGQVDERASAGGDGQAPQPTDVRGVESRRPVHDGVREERRRASRLGDLDQVALDAAHAPQRDSGTVRDDGSVAAGEECGEKSQLEGHREAAIGVHPSVADHPRAGSDTPVHLLRAQPGGERLASRDQTTLLGEVAGDVRSAHTPTVGANPVEAAMVAAS
jgi:hypothetical protein